MIKAAIKTVGLSMLFWLTTYLGFVSPGLGICRFLFYGWLALVALMCLVATFALDKIKEMGVVKKKPDELRKYVKKSGPFSIASIWGNISNLTMLGMLVYGGYYNTAYLDGFLTIYLMVLARKIVAAAKAKVAAEDEKDRSLGITEAEIILPKGRG